MQNHFRMGFNRRIILITGVLLWLTLMLYHSSPDTDTVDIGMLYGQITRALTDSRTKFYGNEVLMKDKWYFEARKDKITPLNFDFITTGANVCDREVAPLLLIVVMSLHNKSEEREAIRHTYGRTAKGHTWPRQKMFGDVRMVFMFGVSKNDNDNKIIENEALIHNDIVTVDFTESYFNLTYKVLMSIKWAEKYCPRAQFIMKVDEDTFVDIPRLTDLLISVDLTNAIYGHFHYNDEVARKGKSEVSKKAYPMTHYPPHVKGNIYVMPAELAISIMHLSQYLPYVNMEDAHVTGNLAKLLNARHHDIPVYQYDPYKAPDLCDFALSRKIAAQQVNASFAYRMWNAIETPELCS